MSATVQNTRLLRMSFADVLRVVWPRNTAKEAANAAGMSVRTAQAWVADRCSPSWATIHRMAQSNDALRAEIISMLKETADVATVAEVAAAEMGTADSAAHRAAGQEARAGARVAGR